MPRIGSASLLCLIILTGYGKEPEKVKSLAEHYGIKTINKVIVMHFPSLDQTGKPRKIELINGKKELEVLAKVLGALSTKGNTFKSWPRNIPTMQIIVLHDKGKYCILRVDNSRLRRPDGGGYGRGDFKQLDKFLDIVKGKAPDATTKKTGGGADSE